LNCDSRFHAVHQRDPVLGQVTTQACFRVGHRVAQADRDRRARFVGGQTEDAIGHGRYDRGLPQGHVEGLGHQFGIARIHRVAGIADHRTHQVVELVGEHSRVGSQRGELLHLAVLLFDLCELAFEFLELSLESSLGFVMLGDRPARFSRSGAQSRRGRSGHESRRFR
jgi:hypothetical protein